MPVEPRCDTANVLRPPFDFKECLIIGCGGIEQQLAQMLGSHGIQVLAYIASVGDWNFTVADGSGRSLEDLAASGIAKSTPIILGKDPIVMGVLWMFLKNAMAQQGFQNFIFFEDLVFPRGKLVDQRIPEINDFLDDVRFWMVEQRGLSPDRVEAAIDFALAQAKSLEIGCHGFGPSDFSMVHWSVSVFAAILLHLNPGPVIEIGTYAGGLTCPLGTAAKALGQSLTSFEIGGSALAHPQMPTADILGDLRANVAAYGLQDCVSIIEMKAENGGADALSFPKASVRMLIIDAEGDVLEKLKAIKDYLAPGCILIVDDFLMSGPARGRKSPRTRSHLYRLISPGLAEEIDVIGWGTWFGRIVSPEKIGPALSGDGLTVRI